MAAQDNRIHVLWCQPAEPFHAIDAADSADSLDTADATLKDQRLNYQAGANSLRPLGASCSRSKLTVS